MSTDHPQFDPWAILGALEKHRVNYVLIGELAGVLHGTDEISNQIEICPQIKGENLARLDSALADLGHPPSTSLSEAPSELDAPMVVETRAGKVNVIARPPGSSGWDDLRRGSTREALGRGIRATVASVDDLARLMTSLGRNEDRVRLATLRRLAELDRGRGIER